LSQSLSEQAEYRVYKCRFGTLVSLFDLTFFLICAVKRLTTKTIIQTMIAQACAQATDCCDWLQQGQMYQHCKQDGI
jgi:hypothetical protein